ncbi:ATP-binding cassette domain-containing protein [Muriicola sp. E247]|uniref:ATP-binding cassette domain-containing protein n=1 Tax=Muriicola sp. E247 TaxID=3242730 RepID=UPI00352454DF
MLHWAIFTENSTPITSLLDKLLNGPLPEGFKSLENKKGALFSTAEIQKWMDEERRHDRKILTRNHTQSLQSMSSGERKKVLFAYILSEKPDYLILDNPFENLDPSARAEFLNKINDLSQTTSLIQILSRTDDLLPEIKRYALWQKQELQWTSEIPSRSGTSSEENELFQYDLPESLESNSYQQENLVEVKNVSVAFHDKPVLKNVSWKISRGDFWELRGANGSGKTTLLSLITGDSPKAYGQDIILFGQKKGSGESVWDIKKRIGYITPALTDSFRGYHSLENMLISGLVDSIGLYTRPTEQQKSLARDWLRLLNLENLKDTYFHDLSKGQQRLIMCARAMIKQPLLLILDEPTADLDDKAAKLVVHLVNKLGNESNTAIVFVSHRSEPGLRPESIMELIPTNQGSIAKILS